MFGFGWRDRLRELFAAAFDQWDGRIGEGNPFQRVLVGPAAECLLAVQPGETILDVACGNGVFSRRLAALGARVVATDYSQRFLELARAPPSATTPPDYCTLPPSAASGARRCLARAAHKPTAVATPTPPRQRGRRGTVCG